MRYLFEDCELDPDRRELRRDNGSVAVEPQVFDLLLYLIANRERIISKDDLIGSIWQGRIVSESTLNAHVHAARSAIGDNGKDQRLIKTLARKGVRFVGNVREEKRETEQSTPGLTLSDRPSIAVLPFANMSGDPGQEHFADGITEDLITSLSRIRWLFVIARNSTFQYKGQYPDIRRIGRELGVRYILEGSVRRQGKRLRISTQLVDALGGGHHWAERYDRKLGDIFAVQDEITRSVAAVIEPRLLAAEGVRALSRSADDLDAWELVARAQTSLWRMTKPDFEAAISSLEEAARVHPEYAPARSLLAFSLLFAAHMGWLDRDRALQSGRQHAVAATVFDEQDPWGHIALGYAALMERRTEESIAAFTRALDLNPNSAAAHAHLGHCLAFSGRDQQAIKHAEEAMRLSPLDPMMALSLGTIAVANYLAGRYAEALHYTSEAARVRPGFHGAHRLRCASLAQMGRIAEARSLLATVRSKQPQFSLDWIRANVPYQTPELMEHFLDGMRQAGLN